MYYDLYECPEVEEMIDLGEKLGPKHTVDISELPGIVVSIKLSMRRGKSQALVADAIVPYPEYYNKDGEDMVYELRKVRGSYEEQLLKNQVPPRYPQEGTRPMEIMPTEGPPELSFPKGVCGHITVRTTVLSKSALLGAKDESKKRKKKAKKAASHVENEEDEGGGGGGAGFNARQALASILPPAWTNDPAVVMQVADEAADAMLDGTIDWLIRTAAGQAFEHQKYLRGLHLERVRASEKTLRALCVCFSGHLCHVSLKGVAATSDAVISSLAELHSNTLKTLNVMHCYRVSDESLTQVATRCTCLTDLNVSDTSQYGTTDATVAAVCRLPTIKHFEAADLALVTDSSLVSVLSLPHLETLNVSGCKRVSDGMFRRIDLEIDHVTSVSVGPPPSAVAGSTLSSGNTSPLKTIRLSCCDISDQARTHAHTHTHVFHLLDGSDDV